MPKESYINTSYIESITLRMCIYRVDIFIYIFIESRALYIESMIYI